MTTLSTEGLQKKQMLLSKYWHQLQKLKEERTNINAKLKSLEAAFQELIDVEATDKNQLSLFEDMDQYLKEEVETDA